MNHSVAIVDANSAHRSLVAEALASSYTVRGYEHGAGAISSMQVYPPKVILVGQKVGAGSGITFIKDLRRDTGLGSIPIIFIADSDDFRIADQLRELGIKDKLVKPYGRNALLSMVSGQLNGQIERGWHDLPPSQRKALEDSLSAFNAIAEELSKGRPLPYQEVSDSCSAVVEVVQSKELGGLFEQIKEHDNLTYVHSLRFSALMSLFGCAIGLPREQQVLVASGGMLHDVGMMAIPKAVLQKTGSLSNSEWDMVRNHVTTSEKVLATGKGIPKGVTTIVTHHHERLDMSGYPRHLPSSELNQLARMAGIIDVFCGLTDRHPYKRTLPPHVALETMATEMSNQLDMDLLNRFKEILLDSVETRSAAQ